MDSTHNQASPDEKRIDNLLSRVRPQPSTRFYQRMKNAPWHRQADQINPAGGRSLVSRRWAWGLAALAIFILVGVAALVPPVRTIARQIIFSFVAAPSDQIEVQVTLTSPGDLFNFSDISNFPLSLPEAQAQAEFAIRQILPTPAGLKLVGARFDRSYNAVILLYQADHYTMFLTQRPLGNSQDVFSVGEGAKIQLVKIGDGQGEFVQGGWKAVSTQLAPGVPTPEGQVNITAVWDDTLPQSTLRWQADKTAYELRVLGENAPSQSELIIWANELK